MTGPTILQALPLAAAALRHRRSLAPPDPVAWVERRLGEHLWSKQAEIARSVAAHLRTAVQSCHGSGKSYTAARVAAWWLDSHTPGDAFVVSTAPTYSQVRAILWREIGRAHAKGHLIGRVNQSEWWIGDEIVGFGRKPSDYNHEAFQGIHAAAVLVLIDEACDFLKRTAERGGSVIFVGIKKQCQEQIKEQAERVGMPYVCNRWLGGLLTNYATLSKRIKRMH